MPASSADARTERRRSIREEDALVKYNGPLYAGAICVNQQVSELSVAKQLLGEMFEGLH
jgi:hypothetical protein